MDLGLTDKTVLVTGGSRGLGRAICLAFAAEGARVAVHYRQSPERAGEVVAQIETRWGVPTLAVQGDLTREDQIGPLFERVEAAWGRLDILVNNAGICPVAPVKDLSLAVWDETLRTNLTGTFLCCREMARRLLRTGAQGRIVNIVSQAAFNGSATGKAHYAASKAGVVALTVSLARELAASGIAVNAVAPGMMETDMTAHTLKENAGKYAKTIPLGRVAETSEVAAVVAFLASPRAGYVTGGTWDVSGGMLMR